MRYLFILILVIGSCTFRNVKSKNIDVKFSKEEIELHFNILDDRVENNKVWRKTDKDFYAILTQTNRGDSILTVPKLLTYGHKGDGDFIEAYDLNGKEIDINNQAHYQWLYWLEEDYFTEIKINESKIDTISMTSFYDFREKGMFKLRFAYEFSGDTIFSNWDTLEIY